MSLALKPAISLMALAALGLASVGAAQAAQTSDPNLFAGQTATANDPFGSAFAVSNLTAGGTTPYVFGDNAGPEIASITGFNSAIGDIRFFDAPDFDFSRLSPSVVIGYSSTASAGLTPASYTLLNGGNAYTLATSNSGNDYLTATSPAQLQSGAGSNQSGPIHFSDVSGLNIPAGTQSVLFEFTVATDPNGTFGSALTEIQGFAPSPVPEASTTMAFGLMLCLGGVAFASRRRAQCKSGKSA